MRFTKNTQHDTSKVLRLPRKMAMDTSKVFAPATQNDFRHVPEHVWMSRSATPATRNEATTRLKPPKITTSAEFPIGTAIRSSRGRLRTVALANATSSEHTLNPQTPRVKREPFYAFGKKKEREEMSSSWRSISGFALPSQCSQKIATNLRLFPNTNFGNFRFARPLLSFCCMRLPLFWIHYKIWNMLIRFWRVWHNIAWRSKLNEAILQNFPIFKFDNIKNKIILRDFLPKWKVKCSPNSLVPMCLLIFFLDLSKILR